MLNICKTGVFIKLYVIGKDFFLLKISRQRAAKCIALEEQRSPTGRTLKVRHQIVVAGKGIFTIDI